MALQSVFSFRIGNGADEYPANGILTDTLFEICNGADVVVEGIATGGQFYTEGYTTGVRSLDYSNVITAVNGMIIKIFLNKPVNIG